MSKSRNGFSLVEMAIVLIIFGLVLASASSILTLFVNKGGAERTRKMIEANKNVLYSIAAADGEYTAATINSLTYPTDAYGVGFEVFIDPTLFKYINLPSNNKKFLDYSPICGTDSTTYSVNVCTNAACTTSTTVNDVAIVIASASANKNVQTNEASSVFTIYLQGTNADDFTGDFTRAEGYDDIVDWVTLPELRAKAGCDPQKIDFLSTDMPDIEEGQEYSFSIYPKGGVPFENTNGGDISKYNFELDDIDELTDAATGIKITMETDDGEELNEGNPTSSAPGTHLVFSGNAASSLDDSYRVRITISDDSATVSGNNNNKVTRTLYIIKK
jgi:prepilin-type N-terminal cleavage/methylation domain-containing protein